MQPQSTEFSPRQNSGKLVWRFARLAISFERPINDAGIQIAIAKPAHEQHSTASIARLKNGRIVVHMTEFIKRIDENTSIPIKTFAMVCVPLLAGMIWINSTLNAIQKSQDRAWTIEEMRDWSKDLNGKNPALIVPSPMDYMRFEEAFSVHRPR